MRVLNKFKRRNLTIPPFCILNSLSSCKNGKLIYKFAVDLNCKYAIISFQ